MPLSVSVIFQLYRDVQFYWKRVYFGGENVVIIKERLKSSYNVTTLNGRGFVYLKFDVLHNNIT